MAIHQNDSSNSERLPPFDTVLFDGECRFCTSSVGYLRRLDLGGQLQFLSLHDPTVAERYPDLSHEQLMREMWVVSRDGRRFAGADAVRYLSRKLPLLYLAAPILHFPGMMPAWRWLYRFVAKNRYRIAGRSCSEGTCRLHQH